MLQRAPRQELHHDVRRIAGERDIVQGGDIGVIESTDAARLPGEALARPLAGEAVGADHLDGDGASDPPIHSAMDRAHAAFAEFFLQLVRGKMLIGQIRHLNVWFIPRIDDRPGRRLAPVSRRLRKWRESRLPSNSCGIRG